MNKITEIMDPKKGKPRNIPLMRKPRSTHSSIIGIIIPIVKIKRPIDELDTICSK
ncbi:hypothetical protein ACP2X3_11290 [Staphylococcus epidermidis]